MRTARELAWPDLDLVALQPTPLRGLRRARGGRRRPPASTGSASTSPSTSGSATRRAARPPTSARSSRTTTSWWPRSRSCKGWCSPPGEASELCRELEDLAYEMADEFGCRYLQAVGPYEGTLADAAPAFAALCDRAAAHGLLVGMEWLPYTNIPTAAEAQELVGRRRPPERAATASTSGTTPAAPTTRTRSAPSPASGYVAVQMNDGTLEPAHRRLQAGLPRHRVPPGEGEFDCVGLRAAARRDGCRPRRSRRGVLDRAVGGTGRRGGTARRGRHAVGAGRGRDRRVIAG